MNERQRKALEHLDEVVRALDNLEDWAERLFFAAERVADEFHEELHPEKQ